MADTSWTPDLSSSDGPLYLAIADALAADIASGKVREGERLPAQRALADTLGIDFTTVGRGFAEARRRGLIEAMVGRGSFARRPITGNDTDAAAAVDMTMNLPPLPAALDLPGRIERGLAAVLARADIANRMTYQAPSGALSDRRAGARWLEPRLPGLDPDRLLVTAGAQAALAAVLSCIAQPGDLILCEALSYPGFPLAAKQLGLNIHGIAIDAQGLMPEALDEACRRLQPRALYCVPVLHSPTTATLPIERRQAIAAIARRHHLTIIEDDTYGLLVREAPLPIASYAPELTYYIGGVAKVLSPALRVAYLTVPEAGMAAQLALRALTGMAPPLMVALMTQWIETGDAAQILTGIRQEAIARQRLALDLLPPDLTQTAPEAHHLWLNLPARWSRAAFVQHLQRQHLALVPSDAFVVTGPAPEAVRLCLGAAPDQRLLHHALSALAASLRDPVDNPAALVV